MSDQNGYFALALQAAMAGVAGFIGMIVGQQVQGTEIDNLKERLNRIEDKLDRLIERET